MSEKPSTSPVFPRLMDKRLPDDRGMKTLALPALMLLALSGCAKINEAGMRLVASNLPTHAMVGETKLMGFTTLHVDRTGTISLNATDTSGLKCMGRLRYTATSRGVISLHCNNGADAKIDFVAIRETVGYGSGNSTQGPVSVAFGFEVIDKPTYLTPTSTEPQPTPAPDPAPAPSGK